MILVTVAPRYGATVTAVASGSFSADVAVPLASGTVTMFSVMVNLSGAVPTVKECEPRRLPAACPERHINPDGSFCLGWGPAESMEVVDEATASAFWARLVRFLSHQYAASRLRRWPGRQNGRAHGDAAESQAIAEIAAAALGARVLEDLRWERFSVMASDHANTVVLLRRDQPVAEVKLAESALVDANLPCCCDASAVNPTSIADCSDHALRISELTMSLHEWQRRHRAFVDELTHWGVRCCGTLERCELIVAGDATRTVRVKGQA